MQRFRFSVQQLEDRHSLTRFGARAGLVVKILKRAGKGGRMARPVAGYLGFNSAAEAMAYLHQLRRQYPGCYVEARPAVRLTDCTHEVKMRHESVEQIVWGFAQSQQATTGQRVERHLAAVASRPAVARDWPVASRGSGRKTLTTADGFCVGIAD